MKMRLSKINLLKIILFLLLIPLVYAETTFFDNPEETFVMGNPAASSGGIISGTGTGGAISSTTDTGDCIYKWNCTNWSRCFFPGKQTRNCANIGTCPGTYNYPETEQKCIYTIFPEADKEYKEVIRTIWNNITGKNKAFIYAAVTLIFLLVVIYLKKDFLKKTIKR
jgi:hypothetical protein